MLHVPSNYYDNWSLLCMLGTQYATLVVLFCVGTVHYNATLVESL